MAKLGLFAEDGLGEELGAQPGSLGCRGSERLDSLVGMVLRLSSKAEVRAEAWAQVQPGMRGRGAGGCGGPQWPGVDRTLLQAGTARGLAHSS